MALILREVDVQALIEMDDVIAAVESAMRELGEGKAQNEPRRRAYAPNGLLNVMFASFPGGRCTGLKAYTVAGGRARFLVVMFGLDGALTAMIEADFMGAYRTGAASAVAARALCREDTVTVGMIGAGWQATTQALALSQVLKIKQLRVFSRDPGRRAAFAREQTSHLGLDVVAAPSAEAAAAGADVVVTITTSASPVLDAAWVEPHALVIAAGSNFRQRTELPAALIGRAQTVVVDQLGAAQLESGDLLAAHDAGTFEWDHAVELAAVVAGTWKAPRKRGITIFESQGLALWDLAAGSAVVRAARERGTYEEVDLLV